MRLPPERRSSTNVLWVKAIRYPTSNPIKTPSVLCLSDILTDTFVLSIKKKNLILKFSELRPKLYNHLLNPNFYNTPMDSMVLYRLQMFISRMFLRVH